MPGRVDVDTDSMMPPALLPSETDEERQRRRLTAAINSPGFRGAAMGAASRPAIAGTDRGNILPERDASDSDSRELYQRALTSVRPSVMPAQPSSAPAAANTMPPIPVASAPRSDANAAPSVQPRAAMPPITPPTGAPAQPPPVQPSTNAMPPVTLPLPRELQPSGRDFSGANAAPIQPGSTPKMPPVTVGPLEKAYEEKAAAGEPQLHGWKKALDVIGSIFPIGRTIETAIPGSPQNYDFKLNQAAMRAAREQMLGKGEQEAETSRAQAQFNTPEKREAYMRQHPEQFEDMSDFEKNDWRVTGKFPQREPAPKTERPENLDREAYDYYVGQGMTPADARKRVLQDAQSVKPERQTHTSAFEAFAYGTPEEKKAAQDYLDFEKKAGARYKTPSEFDERYRLFREDPETYKAMFGDKSGAGPDRATATKMLNYFDKRRREIQNDFMLDDQQKAQQLQDIGGLEIPFMDAVQPGAAVGPANAGGGPTHPEDRHRVSVIAPDGTEGTVPLRQLKDAKKKGYKVKVTP